MSKQLTVGDFAPEFEVTDQDENKVKLADYKGKNVVLYFYPKDDTPGCTIEANDFKDLYSDFQAVNTVILGVSKDNAKSHCKFIEKYNLPFKLLADTDILICRLYNVLKEKSMFGKKYIGINRSTFLIGKDGNIAHIWANVSTKGHAKEVLAAAMKL